MTDVSDLLPTIQAPTIVLHRTGDRLAPVDAARAAAQRIPEARWVELPGDNNLPWGEGADVLADRFEEFLTATRRAKPTDRMLATVLFTDVLNSTQMVVQIGDQRWRALLARHDDLVRGALARFGGREVNTTGDGFLAAFDEPSPPVPAPARQPAPASGSLQPAPVGDARANPQQI